MTDTVELCVKVPRRVGLIGQVYAICAGGAPP